MRYIEKELENLKDEVLEMWTLVYSQLNRAGEALLSLDKDLAREVIYREKRVNAFELKIDSDCEDIIGLYTPVAVDLRFVLAMLKTILTWNVLLIFVRECLDLLSIIRKSA